MVCYMDLLRMASMCLCIIPGVQCILWLHSMSCVQVPRLWRGLERESTPLRSLRLTCHHTRRGASLWGKPRFSKI